MHILSFLFGSNIWVSVFCMATFSDQFFLQSGYTVDSILHYAALSFNLFCYLCFLIFASKRLLGLFVGLNLPAIGFKIYSYYALSRWFLKFGHGIEDEL